MEYQKIGKIVQIDQKIQNKQTNKPNPQEIMLFSKFLLSVFGLCNHLLHQTFSNQYIFQNQVSQQGRKHSSALLLPGANMSKKKKNLANMKMCAGGRIIITCDHTQKNNREYAILIQKTNSGRNYQQEAGSIVIATEKLICLFHQCERKEGTDQQ